MSYKNYITPIDIDFLYILDTLFKYTTGKCRMRINNEIRLMVSNYSISDVQSDLVITIYRL
jgi:hypothetical protein